MRSYLPCCAMVPSFWVILWHHCFYRMARRRLYRRRRRLRRFRRRRRGYRRRRLFIHRRRTGAYYLEKFSKTNYKAVTTQANNLFAQVGINFQLSTFTTQAPRFDYYRIKYAAYSLVPATPPNSWGSWGKGVHWLDYDDTSVQASVNFLVGAENATAKWWRPQRGFRRFFRPQPKLQDSAGASTYFFRMKPWLNAATTSTVWLGLKYSVGSPQPATFYFLETQTIWVLWKNVL